MGLFGTRDADRPSAEKPASTPEESLLVVRLRAWWERWSKFWRILRRNRLGMAGLIILGVFTFMALSAPLVTSLGLIRNPDASLCGADFHYCTNLDTTAARLQPPSWAVLLGTDWAGRDIFARIWWGTQMTIIIGIAASVVSMGLGTFVGMISGYMGGWTDEILMRITDFFLVLPTLVLALVLSGIYGESAAGTSVVTIVMIIGISLWSSTARLVRAQVLSLKERQFVERAKAIGAKNTRIVWFHIFPNAFSLVFAEAILTVAVAILTESFLSYLGLGPQGVVTWGKIIQDALAHDVILRKAYAWIFAPGFAIVLVVMGFTLLGYALDEIFNPRLRKR